MRLSARGYDSSSSRTPAGWRPLVTPGRPRKGAPTGNKGATMKTTVCLNALERATIEPVADGIKVTFSGVINIARTITIEQAEALAYLLTEAAQGGVCGLGVILDRAETIHAKPYALGVMLTITTRILVMPRRLTDDAARALAFALEKASEAAQVSAGMRYTIS